ncbi:MAG: hypothetical protein R3Y39_08630 [Rikenellaceae bacterium]
MFSQIPINLSSLYSELLYTYDSSSTDDMTLQIYDDETDELLGVKKFYSTNTAQINIAPHVRPYAMPTIESYPMGFISTYRNANVSVYLKSVEDNISSSVRQYTISRSLQDVKGLMSSMPAVRSISDGDAEQLYIATESSGQISVVVTKYLTNWSGSYERPYADGEYTEELYSTSSYSTSPDGNLAIFNFVADSSATGDGSQIERVVVSVIQNSELLAEVSYHIIERPAGAVRVAWVSQSGSIEHYTFPVVKELCVDGGVKKSVVLSSAFEGYVTRAALAQIVRSPLVWVDNGGVYAEATVESGSISVASTDTLGSVDIHISYLE